MKSLIKNKTGVSLIAAVAIMVILSVLSTAMVSMLGTSTRFTVDTLRSAQARAIAQAGVNWYMKYLAGISDWSSLFNTSNVTLANGNFDITINSQTTNTINFTVTAEITGNDGFIVQRTMTQSATRKNASGGSFALFWGRDAGATLGLTGVTINGDFWSAGTTNVGNTSSIVNGIAYRPDIEDITGGGTYTEFAVTSPYPAMPVLDTSYYTNLITTYNGLIAGAGTINQNVNLVLNGNTITCQNFNTNTVNNANVTISGYGYIIASQAINLATQNRSNVRLTITPSGGNIVLIAGRGVTVNRSAGGNIVTINSSGNNQVRMYGRCDSNSQVIFYNNSTNVNGALIMSNIRMTMQSSANFTGCTLFLNDSASGTNTLSLTGSGTSIGTLASPCSIISIGRRNPTLDLTSSVSVFGFLYQKDTNNTGSVNLSQSTITGCLVANLFNNTQIASSTITYNASAIPIPTGASTFASKDANSWDGN